MKDHKIDDRFLPEPNGKVASVVGSSDRLLRRLRFHVRLLIDAENLSGLRRTTPRTHAAAFGKAFECGRNSQSQKIAQRLLPTKFLDDDST